MLVGPITAARQARAVGGVAAVGADVEGGFSLRRVVAALDAVAAVAEPRASAIPAKAAGELAPVAGAGLVLAGHGNTVATAPL